MSEYIFKPQEVTIETYPRRSSPGGQQAGPGRKGVKIEHIETGLCVIAQHRRSQLQNKLYCLKWLNDMLEDELK